ncbi:MAG: pilus assembly protein PilY, partial [Gammaproteobacteria bacterium]
AITGDILWSAGPATGANATAAAADHPYVAVNSMIYAMPSDVAMIANFGGGVVRNRAYIGDTGGNVWRIDMNDIDVNNWTVTLLATIQDPSGLPGDPSGLRKFLFPPDVVHDLNGYDAVLIGSGDREHPFDLTVVNRYYMFKDYGIGTTPSNSGMDEGDLFDATDNCIQVCTGATQTAAINDLANASGWFITLGTGERNVGSSVTLNNVTFFNTNQSTEGFNIDNPGDPINVGGSCGSDLGVARQYQIRYDNAIAVVDQNVDGSLTEGDRVEIHPGGGYLPSPVPLTVIINGTVHEGVLSGTEVSDPPGTLLGARLRKYWYKEFE